MWYLLRIPNNRNLIYIAHVISSIIIVFRGRQKGIILGLIYIWHINPNYNVSIVYYYIKFLIILFGIINSKYCYHCHLLCYYYYYQLCTCKILNYLNYMYDVLSLPRENRILRCMMKRTFEGLKVFSKHVTVID